MERDTSLPPRPCLRRHQVRDRNITRVQLAGHAQVKIGRIGENGQVGLDAAPRRPAICDIRHGCGADGRHFEQSDHRQTGSVDDSFDPCGTQAGSRAAEEIEHPARRGGVLRPPARRRDRQTPLPPTPECFAASFSSILQWRSAGCSAPVTIEPPECPMTPNGPKRPWKN